MTAVLVETSLPELVLAGGLAGFDGLERFVLVEVPHAHSLFFLRSLEQPDLEFVVAPPALFFPDYAPEIDDEAALRLGLEDPEDALLLVVLTLGDGIAASTANLLAPIVINQRTRCAAQVLVADDWPLRAPLRTT